MTVSTHWVSPKKNTMSVGVNRPARPFSPTLCFSEIEYWNSKSYGSAFRVKRWQMHSANLLLGVIIPILYPVPLAVLINKFLIKKDVVIRYD